jgi:hypothetical protein
MIVSVTRDSVCAGDDVDAPHEKEFSFPDTVPLDAVIKRVLSDSYLASIAGGFATWVVESEFPIAVVAQQWLSPRMLDPKQGLSGPFDTNTSDVVRLHFRYLQQADPDATFERINRERASAP